MSPPAEGWSLAPDVSTAPPWRPTLEVVAHADWSVGSAKRFVCVATRTTEGWVVESPVRAGTLGAPDALLTTLSRRATELADQRGRTSGFAFLGIDVTLGLPATWAFRAGVRDFLHFLSQTVHEPSWRAFWSPAERPAEIGLRRPFYPKRPGGTRQQHLIDGLGLSSASELRRVCDQPRPGGPTPCPLFWTMGANQVGKATLSAWREAIVPALRDPNFDLRIWPFDGTLYECTRGDLALAEVYPGEVASWLDLTLGVSGGKRSRAARSAQAERLCEAMAELGAIPTPGLLTALTEGFGEDVTGEDAFDALVGVIGSLLCCTARRAVWQPEDPTLERLEGWVLGRPPQDPIWI